MKELSMIRRIDNLGRIVIPVELRRMLDMETGQDLELVIKDDTLVLRRFDPGCSFCGGFEKLTGLEGKFICAACRRKLTID